VCRCPERGETNRLSTALLTRAILGRRYLTVGHLVDLAAAKAGSCVPYEPGMELDGPVTFVGIERPEGLPDGSDVFTLDRHNELVPQ
jgi:hypothetical protein